MDIYTGNDKDSIVESEWFRASDAWKRIDTFDLASVLYLCLYTILLVVTTWNHRNAVRRLREEEANYVQQCCELADQIEKEAVFDPRQQAPESEPDSQNKHQGRRNVESRLIEAITKANQKKDKEKDTQAGPSTGPSKSTGPSDKDDVASISKLPRAKRGMRHDVLEEQERILEEYIETEQAEGDPEYDAVDGDEKKEHEEEDTQKKRRDTRDEEKKGERAEKAERAEEKHTDRQKKTRKRETDKAAGGGGAGKTAVAQTQGADRSLKMEKGTQDEGGAGAGGAGGHREKEKDQEKTCIDNENVPTSKHRLPMLTAEEIHEKDVMEDV
ncbi:unnamed protein product, partial [Mesorhabditis spiculigera]